MKFTSALSTVLVLLPAVTNVIAIPAPVDATEVQRRNDSVAREIHGGIVARQNNKNGRKGQNKNGNKNNNGGNNNKNGGNNNNNGGNNNNNNGGNNNNAGNNNNNGGNNNNNNDPQNSLTLDPKVVAAGLAQNGQDPPVAGQVASLTTTNMFINFCAGQTITNGQQIKEGSCNPVPMGDIIPQANMPSSKFTFPQNFGTIDANKPFTATIAIQNMDTGHFTNAQKNYFSAPQQLTAQGILLAHSHVVIQKMGDFGSPQILDPTVFAFFKGLNEPAKNGVLSAVVTDGLAPGNYRMASIHTGANHSPAVVAVAQHGFIDDMVYFTAK